MTHRATVLVRVVTDAGVVGEAYAGDEDATLAQIVAVVRDELAPALHRPGLRSRWSAAGRRATRSRSTSCATAGSASWRWPAVDLAVWDAVGKALGQPLWRLWGGYRDRVPMIAIGGYYDSPRRSATRSPAYREMGLGRLQVQGRRALAARGRRARARPPAAAAGDDFVLTIDANQGYTVAEAVDLARRVEGLSAALVRGAVPLAQRPPRPARRAACWAGCPCAPARASSRSAAAAT